jgi:hypothetical protein
LFYKKKVNEFVSAAQEAPRGKGLADCLHLTHETTHDPGETVASEMTVKLWADRWNHNLTRVEISAAGEDTGMLHVTVDFQLNQPVEIDIPTEDVLRYEEIEEELQGLVFLMLLGGFSGDEFDLDLDFDPFSTT